MTAEHLSVHIQRVQCKESQRVAVPDVGHRQESHVVVLDIHLFFLNQILRALRAVRIQHSILHTFEEVVVPVRNELRTHVNLHLSKIGQLKRCRRHRDHQLFLEVLHLFQDQLCRVQQQWIGGRVGGDDSSEPALEVMPRCLDRAFLRHDLLRNFVRRQLCRCLCERQLGVEALLVDHVRVIVLHLLRQLVEQVVGPPHALANELADDAHLAL